MTIATYTPCQKPRFSALFYHAPEKVELKCNQSLLPQLNSICHLHFNGHNSLSVSIAGHCATWQYRKPRLNLRWSRNRPRDSDRERGKTVLLLNMQH